MNRVLLEQSPKKCDCLKGLAQAHLIGKNRTFTIIAFHTHYTLVQKFHTLPLMFSEMFREKGIDHHINDLLALGIDVGLFMTIALGAVGSCRGVGSAPSCFAITVVESIGFFH